MILSRVIINVITKVIATFQSFASIPLNRGNCIVFLCNQFNDLFLIGSGGRDRTYDQLIKSFINKNNRLRDQKVVVTLTKVLTK